MAMLLSLTGLKNWINKLLTAIKYVYDHIHILMTYISGISDYDSDLIEFLPLADIINLFTVNRSLNKLVSPNSSLATRVRA